MTQSKALLSLLIVLLGVCSSANYTTKPLQFKAKFYDEKGVFIGSFGATDEDSPIYIASCEQLFPERFQQGSSKMTVQDIIQKVGTEIVGDRHTLLIELNLHVGIFKLPPKAHRAAIQKIIEDTHLDPENPHKMDTIDYEIGGCGYHNNAGDFIHLRAVDGEMSNKSMYPSVAVFNAVEYDTKVDSNQQLTTDSGSKIIAERRVEYTWHTHPPRTNGRFFEQTPSLHDYSFGNNYQYIKQHFLISVKYKWVYYFGFGTHLPQVTNMRHYDVYNFRMTYDNFFSLK
jgi:hypothetical protein